MRLVVIIIAYKGDPWIPKCLGSIRSSTKHDIRLLVVDNYDTPCLKTLEPTKVPLSIVKTDRVMGFAEANNFALTCQESFGDAVVLLNQDTWSECDWIPACADILESAPRLSAISPSVRQYDSDELDVNYASCLCEDGLQSSTKAVEKISKAPAVALMIRTRDLNEVGPFDPIFGSYYEDYDLCRRLSRLRDGVAITRSAWVRHYSGSATTSDEARRQRMIQIIRNKLIYRLRGENTHRIRTMARFLFLDFPRNLLRGLLRTESSQPCLVTLRAVGKILRIAPRICSKEKDSAAWQAYLERIDWHQRQRAEND